MIELQKLSGGKERIIQWHSRPAVYFDHWAFRKISECRHLTTEFLFILKNKGGTLFVSWLNFMEFGKVESSQRRKAEMFLNAVIPNLSFIESTPETVVKREDMTFFHHPHVDREMGKALIWSKPRALSALSAHDLLEFISDSELPKKLERFTGNVSGKIEEVRQRVLADDAIVKRLSRRKLQQEPRRMTRELFQEIRRMILTDKQRSAQRNDASDLVHAVVPACYCDFVLLDKHWKRQVEIAAAQVKKAGMIAPIARVYSGGKNGIRDFLEDFRNFQ